MSLKAYECIQKHTVFCAKTSTYNNHFYWVGTMAIRQIVSTCILLNSWNEHLKRKDLVLTNHYTVFRMVQYTGFYYLSLAILFCLDHANMSLKNNTPVHPSQRKLFGFVVNFTAWLNRTTTTDIREIFPHNGMRS